MTTTTAIPQVQAIFRDTTRPALMQIDDTYQGVLAYATGRYSWPTAQISRYSNAGKHLYRIDVTGAYPHLASILDVERFDATPADAAVWVPARNMAKRDATVYVSRDSVPQLLAALELDEYWLIVADWTGAPHVPQLDLPPNVRLAGVQYDSTPGYDLTAVYSAEWLGKGKAGR